MAKKDQEAGFVSRQISLDEPSFLLFISITSDQGLIHMRYCAFALTQ